MHTNDCRCIIDAKISWGRQSRVAAVESRMRRLRESSASFNPDRGRWSVQRCGVVVGERESSADRCFRLPHAEHVVPVAGADQRGERTPGGAAQAGHRPGAEAGGRGENRAGAGGKPHPQRWATESYHARNHGGQGQVGEIIYLLPLKGWFIQNCGASVTKKMFANIPGNKANSDSDFKKENSVINSSSSCRSKPAHLQNTY